MSTFLERIRTRGRRINAKRAKRLARDGRAQPARRPLEPLALDAAQTEAIQNALAANAGEDLEQTAADVAGELGEPEQVLNDREAGALETMFLGASIDTVSDEELERLTAPADDEPALEQAPTESPAIVRRCSSCREPGHTKANCPKLIED